MDHRALVGRPGARRGRLPGTAGQPDPITWRRTTDWEVPMRILVTGARGKVGRAAVPALQRAGHEVVATDLAEPDFDHHPPGTAAYVKTDLTDAGQVYALIGGFSAGAGPKPGRFDAVVHAGAIPAVGRHAPHVIFNNNLMGTFNVAEACVRWG